MRGRALLAVFLIALGAVPLLPLRSEAAAGAVPIDLGYGPGTLFPVQGGTPVFTAGDQVWAMSHFNMTVQVSISPLLVFPGSNSTTYKRTLEPGVPDRLLTLNSTTFQGLWTLGVVNSSYTQAVFLVSDAVAAPANLTLSGYRLARGQLLMNFTPSPDVQMYGASACIVGGGDSSVAQMPVPPGVGGGYVNLTLGGESIRAVPSAGRANYSLSVDLFHSVSFLLPGSLSTLVSRTVQTAATDSGLVYDGNPVDLSLQHDGRLWPGVYQVRAFFEGPGGVYLSSSEAIITGSGGWVWLGACSTQAVYSNDFTVSSPLGTDPGSWPRSAWLTYEVSGVQGVAYLPLKVNLSAVEFTGAPWGVRLTTFHIQVNSTSGILAYGASNGTIFAVLGSQSGEVGYEAGIGSHPYFSGLSGPLTPFEVRQVTFNVSKLVVQYLVSGSGFAGGKVTVSDTMGDSEDATTGSSGEATFYLPPGTYNVTATGGNSSATGTATLTAGQSQRLVFGGGNGSTQQNTILIALGFAAVLGAMANAALWIRKRERPESQGTKFSQK